MHFQTIQPTQFARHHTPACNIDRKSKDGFEPFLTLKEGQRRYTLPKGEYFADQYHGGPARKRAAPIEPPHIWIESERENYAAMAFEPQTGFVQIWYNPATWAGLTFAQRRLVFWHEMAHATNRTNRNMSLLEVRKVEKVCDAQAAIAMIKEGFNPCQVVEAAELLARFDHGRLRAVKTMLKQFEL